MRGEVCIGTTEPWAPMHTGQCCTVAAGFFCIAPETLGDAMRLGHQNALYCGGNTAKMLLPQVWPELQVQEGQLQEGWGGGGASRRVHLRPQTGGIR